MSSVETLISRATAACGSRYKLAQEIDESESNLSKMARGQRQVTPRVAARLAAIAGDDPREAALSSIVAHEQNPTKREQLARLLRVPAAACIAVALIGFAPVDSYANQQLSAERSSVCILC